MQASRKRASGLNARVAVAVIAAVAVTTTLAMAVLPVLLTSSTTMVVQPAWAQEIPGIDTDTNSLIEQYDIPDADDLIEEHTPPSSIAQPAVYRFPEVGIILHGDNSIR